MGKQMAVMQAGMQRMELLSTEFLQSEGNYNSKTHAIIEPLLIIQLPFKLFKNWFHFLY